ncbi:acetylneuraminic acid synthetase [Thalassobacillus devorans]|uniref:Acetylneuraminic acid synthetase n=1 Tax=Thalassobacillus devorans TaxID=279813 RepID=A0ABQ1NUW4_9BACI|nr:N-acetylneuraminate synthase family protein [Thalassobacillus devorans]NIK28600.1 N-acetylneuraminate synthase [Thalassobacillus devorans]GGC84972.1 acetylneuraminic acid synthetase [Thalassobacillus devorans]
MIIDRNISKYIVFKEESIVNALKKISDNKEQIIFTVDQYGIIDGVLTDGDFRRWVVSQNDVDLNQQVTNISNKDFVFVKENEDKTKIDEKFHSKKIGFIPVLDNQNHLVAIARKDNTAIEIGEFSIDENSSSFIIAEIGNNHNGSLELAKKLVDAVIESGADCAKFQMRDLNTLYNNSGNANDASEDLGSQYTLDLLSRFQLDNDEMIKVFDYCKEKGILPLCTPWDEASLDALENYGMPAYKLASADLTNHELLRRMAKTGKPLICSTGMSVESEIKDAVNILKQEGAPYIFLHCNSTYPAPFKDVELNYMDRLKELSQSPVGYSGHERGINIAIAAVAKGAKVIEKHFTFDRNMEGNDHKVSLLPEEFKQMVEGIREVELALGSSSERKMSQGEIINRENLAKSLVINCDLKQRETIQEQMIEIKSPGKGLQPNRLTDLVGLPANRDFKAGDFFYESDLADEKVEARDYNFFHKWGVPVRYHDYKSILEKTNPDLLEFHLSYKDLEEDLEGYFNEELDLDFVVHTPELFAGDHLLDLCSEDEDYRQHSIKELQSVIDITRSLKKYFKKSTVPCIVTNMGGFTKDKPLDPSERNKYYQLIEKSLSELDSEGVEIIPQTMPPFPWHFGGQRYQNLFMDPSDTIAFCERNNMRVCFDTSHTKLACNHFNWSFSEFVKNIGPYTAHLHIVDATGVDGEGLQIGEGDIDFGALVEELIHYSPKATFIPEIWQGHKNDGEGFWIALERLEYWYDQQKVK